MADVIPIGNQQQPIMTKFGANLSFFLLYSKKNRSFFLVFTIFLSFLDFLKIELNKKPLKIINTKIIKLNKTEVNISCNLFLVQMLTDKYQFLHTVAILFVPVMP